MLKIEKSQTEIIGARDIVSRALFLTSSAVSPLLRTACYMKNRSDAYHFSIIHRFYKKRILNFTVGFYNDCKLNNVN